MKEVLVVITPDKEFYLPIGSILYVEFHNKRNSLYGRIEIVLNNGKKIKFRVYEGTSLERLLKTDRFSQQVQEEMVNLYSLVYRLLEGIEVKQKQFEMLYCAYDIEDQ